MMKEKAKQNPLYSRQIQCKILQKLNLHAIDSNKNQEERSIEKRIKICERRVHDKKLITIESRHKQSSKHIKALHLILLIIHLVKKY